MAALTSATRLPTPLPGEWQRVSKPPALALLSWLTSVAPLQRLLAFYRSVTYLTADLMQGFAKSHKSILFYRLFSLGFLLLHLVLLLLS